MMIHFQFTTSQKPTPISSYFKSLFSTNPSKQKYINLFTPNSLNFCNKAYVHCIVNIAAAVFAIFEAMRVLRGQKGGGKGQAEGAGVKWVRDIR